MKILLGNKGISIIELLAASSIIVGLALYMAKYISDITIINKSIEVRLEVPVLASEIRQLLSDKVSCSETFKGKNALSTTGGVTSIKRYHAISSTPEYPIFTKHYKTFAYGKNMYGNSKIKILGYSLKALADPGDDQTGIDIGSTLGDTTLTIHFQKRGLIFKHKMKLYVETESPSNPAIKQCQTTTTSMASMDYASTGKNVETRPF